MKTTFLHLINPASLTLSLFALVASVGAQSPPVFMTQPQGMIVSPGSTVTLSVEVEGDEPMGFRWRRNSITLMPLETNRTLVISNLRTGGVYTVVVTNAYGQRLSAKAPVGCFTLDRTAAGNVLDLNGGTNHVYELQYIPDVTSTNWIGLTNFLMRTTPFRYVDTSATNAAQRFYRALVQP